MKEAYCSYEISKLLKEKGFDEECTHYYSYEDGKLIEYTNGVYSRNSKNCNRCTSPTHQMACAWLREEYEVYIDIETCYEYTNRNENFKVTGFAFTIHTKDDPCYEDDNSFDSYEEACEAALKYVLENSI